MVYRGFLLFLLSAINAKKCWNNGKASCGPGLASGCPWKEKAGVSVRSMPWSEPSNNEMCVAFKFFGNDSKSTANPWFWLVIHTFPVFKSFTG